MRTENIIPPCGQYMGKCRCGRRWSYSMENSLLEEKHPVLEEYLKDKQKTCRKIQEKARSRRKESRKDHRTAKRAGGRTSADRAGTGGV